VVTTQKYSLDDGYFGNPFSFSANGCSVVSCYQSLRALI